MTPAALILAAAVYGAAAAGCGCAAYWIMARVLEARGGPHSTAAPDARHGAENGPHAAADCGGAG